MPSIIEEPEQFVKDLKLPELKGTRNLKSIENGKRNFFTTGNPKKSVFNRSYAREDAY